MQHLFYFVTILIWINNIAHASSCTQGVNNCFRCLNSTHCIRCYQGYRITLNLSCEACAMSNCKRCSYRIDECQVASLDHGLINRQPYPCNEANCVNCDGNLDRCKLCQAGYRIILSGASCQACAVNNCRLCVSSRFTCDMCIVGYYLSSNTCYVNNVTFCSSSDQLGICYSCTNNYGLDNGVCRPCSHPACVRCPNNYQSCIVCSELYGPSSGDCIKCVDPKCINCQNDSSLCVGCVYQQNIGLNSSGRCSTCTDTHCKICHRNVNRCQSCKQPRGVNVAGQCVACLDSNCTKCSQNYTICIQCKQGFGLDGFGCLPCSDANCLQCKQSYVVCTFCNQTYGVSGGVCIICSDINCRLCGNDASICFQCMDGFGILANSTCQLCSSSPANCLTCNSTNIQQCFNCPVGRILNQTNHFCQLCPVYCTECFKNNASLIQCISCIQHYVLQGLSCNPPICGDLIVNGNESCDFYLGVLYDGCTDICQQQDNFTCWTNATQSVCSYSGIVDINYEGITKITNNILQTNNEYSLRISLSPPLNIFSKTQSQQLFNIFSIKCQGMKIKNIRYNAQLNSIQFVVQITDDIKKGTDLQIEFLPINSRLLQYSLTPNSRLKVKINKTFHYISSSDITLSNIVLYVCYALVALFWLTFLLGVLLKRLAGLEAMFVLQVAYMSFFLLPSNMLITFEQTHPLRFSAGYNHAFTAEQSVDVPSENAPYFSQFHFSDRLLANNFNLCMLLQLISLVMMPIATARLRSFFKNFRGEQQYRKQQQQQSISEAVRQLNRLVYYHEFSYQLLMSSCMLNLMPFILCLTLFFRHGQVLHIPSLVIIGIQLIILVATLIKFMCDPSPFDYFRFSFGIAELKMRHYCLLVLVLVSTVVLMVMLDNLPYACLVPAVLILVYTLAYRPYKQLSENLRSGWNWLAVSSLLFYRVFVGMLCEEQDLNKTVASVYFMVNVLVVLPVTVGMAIVFVVYYYWYYNYKCQEESKQKEKNRQMQVQYYRRKLLGELVRINPNIEMDVIKHQTTFRQLINPNASLLNAANKIKQLQNMIKKNQKTQNYELTDFQQFRKQMAGQILDKNTNISNIFHHNPIKLNGQTQIMQGTKQKYQKYKNLLKTELLVQKKSIENTTIQKQNYIDYESIYHQLNIAFDVDQNASNDKETKENRQIIIKSIQAKPQDCGEIQKYIEIQDPQKLKKFLATDIMRDEQRYINLQAAIQKTKQVMLLQSKQQHVMEQYQKIDQFYQIQQKETEKQKVQHIQSRQQSVLN